MAAKLLIWLAILACTLFGFDDSVLAAEAVPYTNDLRADARAAAQNRQPLLLFITLEGCPFCARVRGEYLGPMSKDPEQNRRALIRELPIEATVPDFEGQPRLGRDIAASLNIKMLSLIHI